MGIRESAEEMLFYFLCIRALWAAVVRLQLSGCVETSAYPCKTPSLTGNEVVSESVDFFFLLLPSFSILKLQFSV